VGDLLQAVNDLARLRDEYAQAKGMIDQARAEWEATNQDAIQTARKLALMLAEAESQLRLAAVEQFKATGDLKAAPGVTIRLMKRTDYDKATAEAWCKDHCLFIIPETVDWAGFEKLVLKAPEQVPCAKLVEVPTAAIATNLGDALAKAT